MRGRLGFAIGVSVLCVSACLGAAAAIADAPPTLTIAGPIASYVSAQLAGTVDPAAGPSASFWHFEYREAALAEEEGSWTQFDGDQELGAETEGSPTPPTEVSDTVSGLRPATEYLVRLVATNEEGANRAVSTSQPLQTKAVAQPSLTIEAVNDFTATTAHFSGTVNPQAPGAAPGQDAAFNAGWRFQCSPECPGLSGGELEADNTAHPVLAEASGLKPGTTYTLTLHASNAGGEVEVGESGPGEAVTFTTPAAAPLVESTEAGSVGSTNATLLARVNPETATTVYHFEYGLNTDYGHTVPLPDAAIGAGGVGVPVSQPIADLAPDTTYHYRVVASNAVDPTEGPDATFHTFALPSPPPQSAIPGRGFLPDGRGWELVSPPAKNGGDVLSMVTRTSSSAGGDAASFVSLTAFSDVAGTGATAEYMSERDAAPGTNGWSVHSLLPPLDPVGNGLVIAGFLPLYEGPLSPELDRGVLLTGTPLSTDPNVGQVPNFYLRSDLRSAGHGSYSTITGCPLCSAPLREKIGNRIAQTPVLQGASTDLSHVIFESTATLTSEAPLEPLTCRTELRECQALLYEWESPGTVRYVGILPESEGGGPAPASTGGHGPPLNGVRQLAAPISEDGSHLVFGTPPEGIEATISGEFDAPQLYLRIDHRETVRLNASERTDCAGDPSCGGDEVPDPAPDPNGPRPPRFQAFAAGDGSRVLFTSKEALTDDAPLNGLPHLYLYDSSSPPTDPHNLILLDRGEDTAAAEGSEVGGVLGVSRDGSYVYFLDRTQLLSGQPAVNGMGIFVWHQGALSYIGALEVPEDAQMDSLAGAQGESGSPHFEEFGSRVSPDGKHLLFTAHSGEGLTGFHQGARCPLDATSFRPCTELYLYDAATGELHCASCSPTGSAPAYDASFLIEKHVGGAGQTSRLNHPLSADGRFVFFTTSEKLVAEDNDGGRLDVYEYDSTDQSLHLLSAGNGDDNSYFLDASPSGHDVFFTTRDRLVGWDSDEANDLYDARIGGGLPEPPAPTPACSGEACRGPEPSPPVGLSGGTGTFVGPAQPRHRHRRRHHPRPDKKRHHRSKSRSGRGA